MSDDFGDAVRAMHFSPVLLICPHCGAMNLPPPASPTITRDQDGCYSCTACSWCWRLQQESTR